MPTYHIRQMIQVTASVTLPNQEELRRWMREKIDVSETTRLVANRWSVNDPAGIVFYVPDTWEVGTPHHMRFTKEYLDEHPCPEDEQFFREEILKIGAIPDTGDPSEDEYTNFRFRMEYERLVYDGIIQQKPPF